MKKKRKEDRTKEQKIFVQRDIPNVVQDFKKKSKGKYRKKIV